MDVFLSVV